MNIILNFIQKLLIFEKEPQKIGLSQLKSKLEQQKPAPTIINKGVKLSDLMKRAG